MTRLTCGSTFDAIIFALIVIVGTAEVAADAQGWIHRETAAAAAGKERNNGAAIISPRMDFEQWTPLGRGDPLKNDPTFDYMPPAVDKVHYWKTSAGSTSVNRVRPPPSSSSAAPAALYNRRFFLTDFSRKEPPQLVQAYAPYKRPTAAAAASSPQQAVAPVRSGYLPPPPRPKTPLPMLTPPPYRWPAPGTVTTVLPVDVPTLVQLLQQQHQQQHQQQQTEVGAGDSTAESKRPPDVRAPPPPPPPPPQSSSHSAAVIKTLLDAEVDRTTVTTPGPDEAATEATADTSPPPPPPFAHYRRPLPQAAAVTDGPSPSPPPQMYLIIQGHSKVRKYGLHAAKSDALQPSASAQDHNHVGHDGPDRGEPSRRRKRDGLQSSIASQR